MSTTNAGLNFKTSSNKEDKKPMLSVATVSPMLLGFVLLPACNNI